MRVLVTGPESSGTRFLTEVLQAAGADALHRSQPEGPDWIDVEAMLDDFDAVVVIVRGLRAHVGSYVHKEIEPTLEAGLARRRKALGRLAPILGHPKTWLVTHSSLASDAETRYLLECLGLDASTAGVVPWRDENAKHLGGE